MTLQEFIKTNRAELDKAILQVVPGLRMNYDERRLWIINDWGLYKWARWEGVNI